jgi:uncharacterized protein (DUF1778 family)
MSGHDKRSAQRATAKQTSLRIGEEDRELIDSAAAVARMSRTEFMVESARKSAVETLLDARAFQLDAAQSAELDALFARPPAPADELRRLMASRAPWE